MAPYLAMEDDRIAEESSSSVPPPRAQDVIMGRGKGPETHAGNVAFLNEIAGFVSQYYSTNSRKAKKQLTWEIVDMHYSKGIRFLCRGDGEDWHDADEESVRVRVGQSLRYLYRQQQQQQLPQLQEPQQQLARLPVQQASDERQHSGQQRSTTDHTTLCDNNHIPQPRDGHGSAIQPPDDFLHAIDHLPSEVLELSGSNLPDENDAGEIDFSGDFEAI